MNKAQSLDSNRLLVSAGTDSAIALELYGEIRDLPIISPHGHVDPNLFVRNEKFESPTDLFIYHDHYITRLLHADGVSMVELRKPQSDADLSHAKNAWLKFFERWAMFAGTASGYWFQESLQTVFGITQEPSAENALAIFEQIALELARDEMSPIELLKSFNIEFLATTDDPCDDLAAHSILNGDAGLATRFAPTFRPDFYIDPRTEDWLERVQRICTMTSQLVNHKGLVEALWLRRVFFKSQGAVSVDIGAATAFTTVLPTADAEALFEKAKAGTISEAEALLYRGNMITEMVRMSCEDELVITLHVGVHRNHSAPTLEKFGRDTGHDLPIQAEFVQNLKPVLDLYGLHPNLTLILFSLDESTWGREIAPLASFYPSVRIGAPWWFLDAPDSATRFREATVEIAGFYRGSGFIDDTRAFLSIPARHDMARKVEAAFLAKLVTQGRISIETARKIVTDIVVAIPKRAFKL
ncbi:MAG: hypothetical protein RL028_883 [Actinomycetota bacterium]